MTGIPTSAGLEAGAVEAARKEYTASLAYGDFGAVERIIRAYLSALTPPSRAVDGKLPLWHAGSWGDGSTPPYLANIFCDAHEATIAAGLPKGIVADIVEAHNDALTALSAKLAETEEQVNGLVQASMISDEFHAEQRRKLEEARKALEGILDACDSFQDEEGYEVAGQVRIRAKAALTSGGQTMRELYPGHLYELDHLDGHRKTTLRALRESLPTAEGEK